MKKALYLLLISLLPLTFVQAVVPDSVVTRAALLAARGDAVALRPLYREHAASLPIHVRLYCDMALARADGRNGRMVECIDSLVRFYPRRLPVNGRLVLGELKAEGLRCEGRYAEMRDFCQKEINYFRRKRVSGEMLDHLRHYAEKGKRLADTSPRGRLLGLADRHLVFELRAAYDRDSSALDDYARLTCRLLLARAFHEEAEALHCASRLLDNFPDSLDTEQLTYCLRAQAEVLIDRGAWRELGAFVDRYNGQSRPHGAPLAHYRRLAEAFAACQPFVLERPEHDCSLPLTYEWPLTVELRLGDGVPRLFRLDTGQGHTLVSERDAKECGLSVLSDTISIASPSGLLRVCPAFASRFVLGEITLCNLLVYVILDENGLDEAYSRLLGTNDLLRLGIVDFHPEKIIFPVAAPASRPLQPDLMLSETNALRLRAVAGGNSRLFGFDTGCPENVFSEAVFPRSVTDTVSFRLRLGERELPVPLLRLDDSKAADHAGLLGVPFLHSFDHLRLDFNQMTLTPGQEQEFARRTVMDYLSDGDPFSLERNAEPLRALALDEVERDFVALTLARTKNRPAEVADVATRLERALDAEAPSDARLVVLESRMSALMTLGRYAEAATVGRAILSGGYYAAPAAAEVSERVATCEAAAARAVPSLEATTERTMLPFVADDEGEPHVALRINGREALACADPGEPWVTLTEKAVRRLKVEVLCRTGETGFGILRELRMGDFVLRNVLCRVVPGKQVAVTVGYNAFRLFPQATFSRNGLTLDRAVRTDSAAGSSLCFERRLFVQGETRTGYVSLLLSRHGRNSLATRSDAPISIGRLAIPAADFVPGDYTVHDVSMDGLLSIDSLLGRVRRLVFDFRHMRLVPEE